MGSLETLASKVISGDHNGVEVRSSHDGTKIIVTGIGDHWSGSIAACHAASSAALTSPEHYPQLTDWVRAQPSGTFLLTVFSKKQTELQRFDLRDAPRKIVLSIRETELSTASFGSGVDYYAVWLSRHVSPECESKIPRGVKVYRER